MTTSVNANVPSTGFSQYVNPSKLEAQEPVVADPEATTSSSLQSGSLLVEEDEVTRLKKIIAVKDRMIQDQVISINSLVTTQTSLLTAKQNLTTQIEEVQSNVTNLEEQLGILTNERAQLQQLVQQNQLNGVPIVQPVQNQNLSKGRRAWNAFKRGGNIVGKFCYRHRKLLELGVFATGVVLSIFFPPATLTIMLATGGGIAFIEWSTSFFAE